MGDGPQAPGQLADLTDPAWQAETSDEEIAQVIMEGRGAMPPFQQIAPQGITALTSHIRAMNREATPEQEAEQQRRQQLLQQQLQEQIQRQGQQGGPPQQAPQQAPQQGPQGPLPPGHP